MSYRIRVSLVVVVALVAVVAPNFLFMAYPSDSVGESLLRVAGTSGWAYLVGGWGCRTVLRIMRAERDALRTRIRQFRDRQ